MSKALFINKAEKKAEVIDVIVRYMREGQEMQTSDV
jgi:hypothetical protein